MGQALKLRVNEARLLDSLRAAFSGTDSLYRELAQNARRAGATAVHFSYNAKEKELIVQDDGCGIEDFSKLFTIAESGWDLETCARETPYGIGALSSLYNAKHIRVESHGRVISERTKDVLAFRPMIVSACPGAPAKGTRITLGDVDGGRDTLDSTLRGVFRGFALPVYVNGKTLERDRADGVDFIPCAVGKVSKPDWALNTPSCFVAYLQGFQVLDCGYGNQLIVHLDPTQFLGRAPDRDSLVEEDKAREKITEALLAALRDQAAVALGTKQGVELALRNPKMLHGLGMRHLLNRLDRLPASTLLSPSQDITYLSENSFGLSGSKHLTAKELAALPVLVPSSDFSEWQGDMESVTGDDILESPEVQHVNRAAYLNATQGAMVVRESDLDPGHWVFSLPNFQSGLMVKAEAVKPSGGEFCVSSNYGDGTSVQACAAVRLTCAHGQAVSKSAFAIALDSEKCPRLLAASMASGRDVVHTFNDFKDEHDCYQERWADDAETEFSDAMSLALGSNGTDVLRGVITDGWTRLPAKSFGGKRFEVRFDKKGSPTVIALKGKGAKKPRGK